ncbi:MAG: heavy-metal-associated domain-containing protein [Tannerella sp.]|jgi:Cu2+-exporting ATPase|nr:heavy-metal-associated domain-containing protein [Tannerella sp.]
MKKEFKIAGMSCGHCRKSVEDALNSIEGVNAVVTLQPPLATIEFINGELPLEKLQGVLSETGDFTISYC